MRAFVTLNGSRLILPWTAGRSTVLRDIDRRLSRRLTNQANRRRADGAQRRRRGVRVERVVRRRHLSQAFEIRGHEAAVLDRGNAHYFLEVAQETRRRGTAADALPFAEAPNLKLAIA
jgi:hypothetical protein